MNEYDGFFHYLPVTDDAIRWGIYVTGAGRGVVAPGQRYPPANHPSLYRLDWQRGRTLAEFQMILITDGRGVFESAPTGVCTVESGTLLFLLPDIWHRYRPHREWGWTERWLSFDGELAHRLVDQGVISAELAVVKLKNQGVGKRDFDRVLDRIHRSPAQNSILLSLHAMTLLATLIQSPASEARVSRSAMSCAAEVMDPLVSAAIEFIWTRSHQPISVPQIARALNVNRRTLERRFQAIQGQSILAEVNACRLSRARRLLVETDLPVKVVTRLAGFSSQERMRVTFVQREGLSPAAYRAVCRQQGKSC